MQRLLYSGLMFAAFSTDRQFSISAFWRIASTSPPVVQPTAFGAPGRSIILAGSAASFGKAENSQWLVVPRDYFSPLLAQARKGEQAKVK
jgi:hypothetical protein